jgi:thiamine pyrophosphokinase
MHRRLEATGCQLIAHPAHKDETDLELALRYAVDQGATEVLVFGALGGRLDQTLANVLLLALPELRGVRVKIVGPELEVLLVRDQETIEGRPGDTVTLLPIGGDVTGITTEGLEYPLRDGTLYFGPARGVSNALTAPTAHLRVKTGLLLVVHITG